MSMLSTLLFSPPPPAPKIIPIGAVRGHIRRSDPDSHKFDQSPMENRHGKPIDCQTKAFYERSVKVFMSVRDGAKTISEICLSTGFSKSTIRSYLIKLEEGNKIVVDRSCLPVIFKTAPKVRFSRFKK